MPTANQAEDTCRQYGAKCNSKKTNQMVSPFQSHLNLPPSKLIFKACSDGLWSQRRMGRAPLWGVTEAIGKTCKQANPSAANGEVERLAVNGHIAARHFPVCPPNRDGMPTPIDILRFASQKPSGRPRRARGPGCYLSMQTRPLSLFAVQMFGKENKMQKPLLCILQRSCCVFVGGGFA